MPLRYPLEVQPGGAITLSFKRFYQSGHNLELEELNQAYQWEGKVVRDGITCDVYSESMQDSRTLTAAA